MYTSDFTPAPAADAVGRVLVRHRMPARARSSSSLIGGLPDDLTWDHTIGCRATPTSVDVSSS